MHRSPPRWASSKRRSSASRTLWSDGAVSSATTPMSRALTRCFPTYCEGRLEPLTTHIYPRELTIETRSRWTMYVSNSLRGTDPAPVAFLAQLLSCRSVMVRTIPHTAGQPGIREGRNGSLQFAMFGPRPDPIVNDLRGVHLSYDGDRWVFGTTGKILPFEHAERYRARRLRDRFTSEM